jgi:hypothetical protein
LLALCLAHGCTKKEEPIAKPEPPREVIRLVQGEPKTLSGGDTLLLTRFVVEEIAGKGGQSAGEAVVTTVRFEGEEAMLSEAPPGYPSHEEAWIKNLRLRLVDAATLGEIGVYVDRRTERILPGSKRAARVERDKSVALADGLFMRFDGHGHKMVRAGQKSPLMVRAEYHRAAKEDLIGGELLEAQTHMLDPDEERVWRWRDFELELKDHKYDEFMALEIRRLAMEPLR